VANHLELVRLDGQRYAEEEVGAGQAEDDKVVVVRVNVVVIL
jgi:hypothetical protein